LQPLVFSVTFSAKNCPSPESHTPDYPIPIPGSLFPFPISTFNASKVCPGTEVVFPGDNPPRIHIHPCGPQNARGPIRRFIPNQGPCPAPRAWALPRRQQSPGPASPYVTRAVTIFLPHVSCQSPLERKKSWGAVTAVRVVAPKRTIGLRLGGLHGPPPGPTLAPSQTSKDTPSCRSHGFKIGVLARVPKKRPCQTNRSVGPQTEC